MAEPGQTTVIVVEGWAVYAEGRQRTGGERVQVDAALAKHWCARGWAEPAPAPNRRRT